MIQGTAMAWVEALTNGRAWDEARDRPRFKQAFVVLAGRRRQWPAPVDFLEALPRVELKALPKLHIPPNPERVKAALDEISKSLNGEVAR